MKKTLLTALALLMLSAGAWADPINLKKAKELAADYMHGNNLPEVVETAVTKRKSPTGTPPLYIFNRGEGKGFIIISGDDCMPSVLGYTEQGNFTPETLPPSLLEWIEGYSQIIQAAQAQGLGPRVQTRANDKENIAPLVSAHWSQGAPYNNLCLPHKSSTIGEKSCPTVRSMIRRLTVTATLPSPNHSRKGLPCDGN